MDTADALEADGLERAEAERLAVAEFGAVHEVAPGYQAELTAVAGGGWGCCCSSACRSPSPCGRCCGGSTRAPTRPGSTSRGGTRPPPACSTSSSSAPACTAVSCCSRSAVAPAGSAGPAWPPGRWACSSSPRCRSRPGWGC
ncbi:hypothetical protein [[Actinomadura] parvosata]|uniref:hypothetical protein n=1 Tax=[Actinomadura] parvosata TaxID=1955412 RepID=UPI001FE34826